MGIITRITTLRRLNAFIEKCNAVAVDTNVQITIIFDYHINYIFYVEMYVSIVVRGAEFDIQEFDKLID